jgi:Ras family
VSSLALNPIFKEGSSSTAADITLLFYCSHNYPSSRQVESTEGEQLAQTNNAAWIETSAKDNINIG